MTSVNNTKTHETESYAAAFSGKVWMSCRAFQICEKSFRATGNIIEALLQFENPPESYLHHRRTGPKNIIAIIIIMDSRAYVRREGNGSFKSPALE